MDNVKTFGPLRGANLESLLRRQLVDKRYFELVIDDLVARQPDQYVRLFNALDDIDAKRGQGILVELSLAGRYATHPRVQGLMVELNERRAESLDHRFITGDDPHVLLDMPLGDHRRLSIGQVAGDVSDLYYRDETKERLKPASEARLNAELERQARIYFANLQNGQEEERGADKIGHLLLQRAWQAAGMSEDEDIEEIEIRESFRLMGVRESPDRGDGLQRWEAEYQKVTRVISDNDDTGWQDDVASRAWRSDSQFSLDLFWLSFSQTADVVTTAATVVAVAAVVVVAWEAGAIAALVRAGGGAVQVFASIAISEAIYLLTHERWTLRGLLVAGIEGYLGALGFKAFAPVGAAVAGRIGMDTFRQLVIRWMVRHGTTGALTGVVTGPAGVFADDLIRIAQEGGGRFSGLNRYLTSAAIGLVVGAVAEIAGSALLAPIFRTADTTTLHSLDEVVGRAMGAGVTPTQWTAHLTGALSKMRGWARGVLDDAIADGMMVTLRQRIRGAIEHYRIGWNLMIQRQVVEFANQPLTQAGVNGLETLLRSTQGRLDNDAMLGLLRHVAREPVRIPSWLSFVGGLNDDVVRGLATGGQLRELAEAPAALVLANRRTSAEVVSLLGQRFNNTIADLETFSTRLNALEQTVADNVLDLLRTRSASVSPESLIRIAEAGGLDNEAVAGLVRLMQLGDRVQVERLLTALPDAEVATYLNRLRTVPQDELNTIVRMLNDMGPDNVAWASSLPTADANTLLRGLSADARTAIRDISALQAQSLKDLVGVDVLNNALTNGSAHGVKGAHLQALRNHFSDSTLKDYVTWASASAARMNRLLRTASNVYAAASRLASGGQVSSTTLVLDSNAMFAMEELMRGTPFANLTPNRQEAINAMRSTRGLGPYVDPPTGVPSLDHIVGPNADLRSPLAVSTEAVSGEARLGVSPVLDDLTSINVARSHADYDKVLQELTDKTIGGSKGALDRSVVADSMFAETQAGIIPRLVTTDRDVLIRLADNFAVAPTTFSPTSGGGSRWTQLLNTYPGRQFTIEISGHRLILIFGS